MSFHHHRLDSDRAATEDPGHGRRSISERGRCARLASVTTTRMHRLCSWLRTWP